MQPFEAAAGFPAGVPPTDPQPAQQHSAAIPNEPKHPAANPPTPSPEQMPPDVVQPFEAAAGFPAGVPPTDPQPAQQHSAATPNEPKPPTEEQPDPEEFSSDIEDQPEYEFFTVTL